MRGAVLALWLALGSPYATAHPDWYLARLKPPNGGQLRNAGAFHLELVLNAQEIRLYVSDHFFNKFPTKNSSATAIVVSGDKVVKVALTPAGENLLAAKGSFARDAGVRVGILLNPHRYPPQAARFTPFQALNELAPPAARIDGRAADGKPDN
jgi:hypothetical protein